MHPDEETLAAIALGEPVDAAVAAHAASCGQCGALVAELRATLALAREASGDSLVSPPVSVWQAVVADLGTGAAPLPDAPSTSSRGDELAPRRRVRFSWIAVAAGVVVGLMVGVLGARTLPGLLAPSPTVVATAPLVTLDTGTQGGDVELLQGRDPTLDLRIRVTPLDPAGGYLEVWLINTDLKRMVSIGLLPKGASSQDFTVTRGLIDQGYVIVDISREQFDDRPQHSGDSLLRGSLN
ncbi:MAG: anti-sigma factor [Propionicimonas sp.]